MQGDRFREKIKQPVLKERFNLRATVPPEIKRGWPGVTKSPSVFFFSNCIAHSDYWDVTRV